ncbi:MAG: DUF2063 domain-containing protein [Methylobacter sp.]|nr:MAG: DUF2063 domain-containing protein [Methylobacter sp.]
MAVDFKAKQAEFAAYIRDPQHNPAPSEVKAERMAMYRELIFTNVENFLSSNFPVLRSLHTDRQWHALTQDFLLKHRCESPYFSEIPEEFLTYLQNQRHSPADYPFLFELAHYEWVEMALSVALDTVPGNTETDVSGKLLTLSPLAWPLAYRYPVQTIGPGNVPLSPPEQPTFILVYRDLEDDVNFLVLTPLTFRLLQILQDQDSRETQACLEQLAGEFGQLDSETVLSKGFEVLQQLAGKNVVLINQVAQN